MAEIKMGGTGGIDISGIFNQILPLITTFMSLMLTFSMLKMVFGLFSGGVF